jgi:hypothetical protein
VTRAAAQGHYGAHNLGRDDIYDHALNDPSRLS